MYRVVAPIQKKHPAWLPGAYDAVPLLLQRVLIMLLLYELLLLVASRTNQFPFSWLVDGADGRDLWGGSQSHQHRPHSYILTYRRGLDTLTPTPHTIELLVRVLLEVILSGVDWIKGSLVHREGGSQTNAGARCVSPELLL